MITVLKLREAVDLARPLRNPKTKFLDVDNCSFQARFRSKSEEDGFELVTIRTQPLPVYLEIHPPLPPCPDRMRSKDLFYWTSSVELL